METEKKAKEEIKGFGNRNITVLFLDEHLLFNSASKMDLFVCDITGMNVLVKFSFIHFIKTLI